jgi:hypothetical protein
VQYSPQLELLNKEKLILINKLVCNSPLFLDNGKRGTREGKAIVRRMGRGRNARKSYYIWQDFAIGFGLEMRKIIPRILSSKNTKGGGGGGGGEWAKQKKKKM